MASNPPILVFAPGPGEAARYAGLIRARFPDARLTAASTTAEAAAAIPEAEILFGYGVAPAILKEARALRWVHKASAGVEDVVFAPERPSALRLTRTDGAAIAPRMIEYVLGAIFFFTQDSARATRQQRERRWDTYEVDRAEGCTVGVAGLGDIGSAIARRLAGNGMRVLGWRRSPAEVEGVAHVFAGDAELQAFVSACDFVVAVLPATAETDRLFDAEAFAAMRSGAVFINVGRGNCVDEQALVAALRSRQLRGAALDVFAQEPLPPASPLWALDNLLLTPHVSGPLVPEEVVSGFLDNYARYRAGQPLLREVDLAKGY